MAQPRYVVKERHNRYVQADEVTAVREEVTRAARRQPMSDLGFTVIEGTGRYRTDVLRLLIKDCRRAAGQKYGMLRPLIHRSAAGVKGTLRRLRPEEAERLDALDARIEEAENALTLLRVERRDTVREAWAKAHVVRLAEVEATLDG